MSDYASIGFRLHTGWAMVVAVAAEAGTMKILRRGRIELLPPGQNRFVYHQAAELPLAEAERLIESVRSSAEAAARIAIKTAIENLTATRACIPLGSASVPAQLAAVLQSHARIHTAEGALYCGAVASACEHLAIPLLTVRERDVWSLAAASLATSEQELKVRIDAVRGALGPPWTADHKIAAAAALIQT